ncbi:conserved membrane hypothetical protein [Tenacibaculum sp. 190524A02b]|uniref:SMODS-associating 2TM beta-strand rich effector domain-containing protein n=1 Tax=Tenacibaculum vairaonense TaxID=3137860 RepID=A0ABP1F601_9FLAO
MNIENIKNTLFKYFKVWWIPIMCYLIPFFLFLLGEGLKRDSIINVSLILFFINIVGNIISAIVQVFIKKWYCLVPQVLISGLLFVYVSIVFIFSPPDYYGVHKEIPKGIEIYEPMDIKPTKKELEKHKLVLTSSIQPGIYNYYTDYKATETGYFYIKAFEITSNDPLSIYRIKLRSKSKVETLEAKMFSGEFTIYEGSWGDKYGARIELWFSPSNSKQDYKIIERNYIVEGWMR